jgi:hypothetical protein
MTPDDTVLSPPTLRTHGGGHDAGSAPVVRWGRADRGPVMEEDT